MPELPIAYRGVVYPWQCDHMGHVNAMWHVGEVRRGRGDIFIDYQVPGRDPSHAKLRKLNFLDIHADKLSGDR